MKILSTITTVLSKGLSKIPRMPALTPIQSLLMVGLIILMLGSGLATLTLAIHSIPVQNTAIPATPQSKVADDAVVASASTVIASSGNTSISSKAKVTGQNGGPTGAHALNALGAPTTSAPILSDTTLVIDATHGYQQFTITSTNGIPLDHPEFAYVDGLVIFAPYNPPGVPATVSPTSWKVNVNRANVWDVGDKQVNFVVRDYAGHTFQEHILVKLMPIPYFTVVQNPLTKADTGDTTTYSAHITLQPHGDMNGAQISMGMSADLGCIVGPNTDANKTIYYNGQNDFTLSCAISKTSLQLSPHSFIRVFVNSLESTVPGGASFVDDTF